uniref:Putative secreted protein n=1 Tax=Anopheles marajoara TaxID=58244 RepID=A0A2M4C911_9DIPT
MHLSSFWLKLIRLTTSGFPYDHRYLMKVLMIGRYERCWCGFRASRPIPICALPYHRADQRPVFVDVHFGVCGHNQRYRQGPAVTGKHIWESTLFFAN